MTRNMRWIALATVLSAALIFLLVKLVETESPVEVRIVSAVYQDIDRSVSSNGKVTPIEDFQARAAFAGMVQKIHVHIGEKVHPGQMLIQLSDPFSPSRYASAQAALLGAEVGEQNIRQGGSQDDRINIMGDLKRAQLEQVEAQKQLSLAQQLGTTGAASQGEIEAAQQRLNAANATLNQLRDRSTHRYSQSEVVSSAAHVADAKASLEMARALLANANITSSIAGTVYSLPVSPFDFVNMGAELLRVADLTKVQVRAYIDEPEIGQIALGEPVTVKWEARPDKIWHGHVTQVPLTVSALGTRTVGQCIIGIDDADDVLLPNTDVTVNIITAKRTQVLAIPRSAVHADGPNRFVFRVVDGKLVQTSVQIGIVNLDQAEITGGLSAHDVVALYSMNVHNLTDGLTVKAVR